MAYYTVVTEKSFTGLQEFSAIIPDTGASVAVEFWNGNEWVTDTGSPVTEPKQVLTRNMVIKFTPTDGGFHLDEGGVA